MTTALRKRAEEVLRDNMDSPKADGDNLHRTIVNAMLALAAEEFARGQREMQAACAAACRQLGGLYAEQRGKYVVTVAKTPMDCAEAIEKLPGDKG